MISDIDARITALENVVLGHARRAPAAGFDRRLNKPQLAAMLGTSTRTIDRHVKAGLLPPPDEVVNLRPYWWVSSLEKHRRKATRTRRTVESNTVTT